MKNKIILLSCGVLLLGVAACTHKNRSTLENPSLTSYVDLKIGTGAHGHVFIGANVPFGMVQLGPTSIPQEWDWVSGYHDSDSTVIGFSHTHMSGTGIGDLFDITIMPVVGDVTYSRGNESDQTSGLWSYADRSSEIARPGYYSVPLERYNVLAELTATKRVGIHRYTFPKSDSAAIVIDLANGGCWDRPTETIMNVINDSTVSGLRRSSGWAKDQYVYFVAEFSKPFKSFELKGENNMYGRASFDTDSAEQVLVKVALSPVSAEGAMANMQAEMPGWDFDNARKAADQSWNEQLGRVRIETENEDQKRIFYTSLFHSMFYPMINSDVDHSYRGADGKIHTAGNRDNYTLFSLWDTYRAEMPLLSIIGADRYGDMINSMIDIYSQQGRLPVWFFWSNETDCMVGNPGIIPVADAVVKRIEGVDPDRAMEAVKATAMNPDRGNNFRIKYGYIPSDSMLESVAYDMEYAIADGAIARAAATIGDSAATRYFSNRSKSYRIYFDKSLGFVRGRLSDGSWRTPFSPFASTHRADDFCEGNAWQYTWLAPHDVEGMIELFGSRERMLEKLDSLFIVQSVIEGEEASPDISGLIGQYAHGNEPVHHVLYLYSMLGEPRKTAEHVREVLTTLYTSGRDGISGNEDAGQMSAWYVLSSLGFYQAVPGSGEFWFGSPLFDKAEISVPGGLFVIKALNNSRENKYIKSVKLNGHDYTLPFISYDDIMKGGELIFEMGL